MAIINNNVQNVKFLRNGTLFATHEDALTAINNEFGSGATIASDGTAILARYTASDNNVKTLVGFIYFANAENKSLTIVDVEGASADVQELREEINAKLGGGVGSGETETVTAQLTALSGNSQSTSADTSVEGAKRYADQILSDAINGLDYAGPATGDGKVLVNVTETDGVISGVTAEVGGLKLTDYSKGSDSGAVATTDTINQAISKLEKQVDAEKDARIAAIDALDLEVVSGTGEIITAVSEANGKVSASKTAIKDVKLTGYKKTSATGAVSATDDVEDAISKIENNIAAIGAANTLSAADKSVNVVTADTGTTVAVNIRSGEKVIKLDTNATSGGIYTDIDLVKITAGLPAEIKERYQLLASDDTQLGANIDIYKDSSIVSITYITDSRDAHYQNLEYKYIDASGNTQTEYVDISSLVLEAEFASGVTITNHIAHGVVDAASEQNESNVPFLTVGADGFKVSGIKDAIDTKINKLDADLSGNTTHVTVGVKEVDGKITAVTVAESDIASKSKLDELSGKTFTVATSSNASITTAVTTATDGTKSVDIITDASKIKMSGFTAAESGFTAIAQSSSVTEAFKAVETAFIENEEVIASSLNDLNTKIAELSGGSEQDLSDEIEERRRIEGQNGSAYTKNTSSAYISGATSLNDADVKLAAALKNVEDNYVGQVTVNGTALAETNNAVNVQIESATGATTAATTNAIVVQTDANGKVTLGLNYIDCGTY